MTALHIRRHIDSDTLRIPELRELIGRDVEIVVREVEGPKATADELERKRHRLYGSLIFYDDPFEPVDVDDWEALD